MEVRQGIFELCDSRKIAGRTLHPDTLIFAAVNGGEHGAQYQVGEMDPAELDRYTVFDVEPTVEDWLDWSANHVSSEVWDFINANHAHLEHKDEYEPNKVYPSRRSWVRLDKALRGLKEVEHGPTLYHLTNAFVGMEAAVAFNDFIQNYDRQVTVEDILDKGKFDKIKDWKNNDHLALIEKMKAEKVFDETMNETRIENLAEYFVSLPSEIAMTIWTCIGKGKVQANIAAFHGSKTKDGTEVKMHLVKLLSKEV